MTWSSRLKNPGSSAMSWSASLTIFYPFLNFSLMKSYKTSSTSSRLIITSAAANADVSWLISNTGSDSTWEIAAKILDKKSHLILCCQANSTLIFLVPTTKSRIRTSYPKNKPSFCWPQQQHIWKSVVALVGLEASFGAWLNGKIYLEFRLTKRHWKFNEIFKNIAWQTFGSSLRY